MPHTNNNEIESWEKEFDEKFEDDKFSIDYLDSCNRFHVDPNLIKSFLHQELQKAREEVEEMIGKMARKVDHVSEEDHEGSVRYFVEATNIYSIAKDYGYFKQHGYQSELDQLNHERE